MTIATERLTGRMITDPGLELLGAHEASGRERREDKARAGSRAEAYAKRTSSTRNKRNAVIATLAPAQP